MIARKQFSQKASVIAVAMIIGAFSGCAAAASQGITGNQLQSTATGSALVNNLQQNLRIFTVAAQKYVFENTGAVPWNQNQSTTPVLYAPFLLYAGSATSATADSICGFNAGSGTPVPYVSSPVNIIDGVAPAMQMKNPVSWSTPSNYLPAQWHPSFRGTYCAVVTLNEPSAQQASLVSYYVSPNGTYSDTFNIQMPPSSVAFQGGSAIQESIPSQTWISMWKPSGSTSGSSGTSGMPTTWKSMTTQNSGMGSVK